VDKNKKIILTLFGYLISVTLLVAVFKDTNFEKIFEQLKKNGAHIPDRTEDLFLTIEECVNELSPVVLHNSISWNRCTDFIQNIWQFNFNLSNNYAATFYFKP